MDDLNKRMITTYFGLSGHIKDLNEEIKQVHEQFYEQSFCGSSLAFECDGLTPIRPFNTERDVIDLATAIQWLHYIIRLNEFRQKAFDCYLATLTTEQMMFLIAKYQRFEDVGQRTALENQTLDEINEIEAAVCFRFDLSDPEPPTTIKTTNTFEDNMEAFFDDFWG